MKQLIKHVFASAWGDILSFVLSFSLSIITARFLGVSGKGEFSILTTGTFILESIFCLRIQHSITYFISKDYKLKKTIIFNSILFGLISLIFVIFSIIVFHRIFSDLIFKGIKYNVLTIFFLCSGYYFWSILLAIFAGTKEFSIRSVVNAGLPLLNIVLIVLFWLNKTQNISNLLLVIGVAETVICITVLLIVMLSEQGTYINFQQVKDMIWFSVKLFPGIISDLITLRIDIFFVNYFMGTSQVGLYSVGISIANILLILPTSVKTVLFPLTVKKENAKEITEKTIKLTVLLMSVFSIITLPVFWNLVIPIYGTSYSISRVLYLLLLPGTIFWGVYNLICSSLEGTGKPFLVSIISLIGGLLTIMLDVLLISKWGAIGAAMASTLSYFFVMILSILIFQKVIGKISVLPTINEMIIYGKEIILMAKKYWSRLGD